MNTPTRAVLITALMVCHPAQGQWESLPDPSIPRTAEGEPDLTAPVPRAPDGKPDLSGVWVMGPPLSPYMFDVTADYEPDELELAPWAAELYQERVERDGVDNPQAYCKPSGVPYLTLVPLPYKIVQTPKLILILYEENTDFRQIFLDGRKVVEDPLPRWMGYSTGRWEGDVLVVETTGMAEDSWLDEQGHPHSASMRVTERFRRPDPGHLEIATTIDDPDTYSRPFTYTVTANIMPDDDLLEYFCSDYEQSIQHYQLPP